MDVLADKYYNPLFYEKCLWFLKASADCFKINYYETDKGGKDPENIRKNIKMAEFDYFLSDTYLYLHLLELILIWISTWLLLSGFKKNLPLRIIPWIMIAIWNMLTKQYFSTEIIIVSVYRITNNYFFGMYTLLVAILCFAFRIYCWLRILKFTFCYVASSKEKAKLKKE